MNIVISVPGKLKNKFIKEGCEYYLEKLKHYTNLSINEVRDEPFYPHSNIEKNKEKESERLLSKLSSSAVLIALDENGKQQSSIQLAETIQQYQLYSSKQIAFLIGGSMGHSKYLISKATHIMSISEMTFPHEFVRLMLLEQIYRAYTIIAKEPYHHA